MNEGNKFRLALIINSSFAIFELLAGIFSGSLALISDAIHNVSDSLSLIIAWIASQVAARKAGDQNTYGLKRAKILAAMINAMIIFGVAAYIITEAYHKFLSPKLPEGGIIIVVAAIGFVINSSIAFLFRNNNRDLNQKATFVNMAMDAFASLMTIVAGVLIFWTNNLLIDPIVSLMIGVILLYNGWEILQEAVEVLLETAPKDIDQHQVKQKMLDHECVLQVVDLHIWSLTSEYRVLTAVININQSCLSNLDNLVEDLKSELSQQFQLDHLTIETRTKAQPHLD
jgi:cobalt-zinc-cadmium efflux system protein